VLRDSQAHDGLAVFFFACRLESVAFVQPHRNMVIPINAEIDLVNPIPLGNQRDRRIQRSATEALPLLPGGDHQAHDPHPTRLRLPTEHDEPDHLIAIEHGQRPGVGPQSGFGDRIQVRGDEALLLRRDAQRDAIVEHLQRQITQHDSGFHRR